MTRKRKSRKVVSNGQARLSKDKLRELRALKEQRSNKKSKGQTPGNRNSQHLKVEHDEAAQNAKADSRTGSKKPVPLVKAEAKPKPEKPTMRRDLKPAATLAPAKEPELTPEQELLQIESDERFLDLIDRHDQGEILQGKDAKYFNAKVERHQALCDLLGIDDLEEDDEDMLDAYMNDSLSDEWLDDEDEK